MKELSPMEIMFGEEIRSDDTLDKYEKRRLRQESARNFVNIIENLVDKIPDNKIQEAGVYQSEPIVFKVGDIEVDRIVARKEIEPWRNMGRYHYIDVFFSLIRIDPESERERNLFTVQEIYLPNHYDPHTFWKKDIKITNTQGKMATYQDTRRAFESLQALEKSVNKQD